MDIVACPDPTCPAPAWVYERWTWSSTSGPVEHAKTGCEAGHWFTPQAASLTPFSLPNPATARGAAGPLRRRRPEEEPVMTDLQPWTSDRPDVGPAAVPMPEFVLEHASRFGDKPALVDGPTGRTLTYRQLADGVERLAAGLAARGFGRGDVLALSSPNLPEYALALYGAMAAGGAVTGANPLLTAGELAGQLADAGASALVTVPPFLDVARAAAEKAGVGEVLVFGEAEGATPFASLLTAGDTPPHVRIDPVRDLAALPYSSGTTGLPKGVELTHANLHEPEPDPALQPAGGSDGGLHAQLRPGRLPRADPGPPGHLHDRPRPDPEAGELPVAYVALRAGATAAELQAWVAERVAPFKRLRDVRFVDQVPRSPTGKLLRRTLVEAERAGAGPTPALR